MARIVVADACELGRRYASELLQYDGHQIIEVDGFESLLAHLLYAQVDAVVLDPSLPGMTREGLRHFLRGPRSLGPLVFLLSEGPIHRLRSEAGLLGAEGAFVKGEEAVELVHSLREALSSRRSGARPEGRLDPWPSSDPPHRPWEQGGSVR